MPFNTLENIETLDLSILRGDSKRVELYLSECEQGVITALSLENYTATAQIRDKPRGRLFDSFTVTVLDEDNGHLVLTLTTDQTSGLRAGTYVWDLQVAADTDTDENTHTLIRGTVTVLDDVTQ